MSFIIKIRYLFYKFTFNFYFDPLHVLLHNPTVFVSLILCYQNRKIHSKQTSFGSRTESVTHDKYCVRNWYELNWLIMDPNSGLLSRR
jgi:hypothetical protein